MDFEAKALFGKLSKANKIISKYIETELQRKMCQIKVR
jgi:hypothetical protein